MDQKLVNDILNRRSIENKLRAAAGETPVEALIDKIQTDYDPIIRQMLGIADDWPLREPESETLKENESAYLGTLSVYKAVAGLTLGTKINELSANHALGLRLALEGLVRNAVNYGYNIASKLAKDILENSGKTGVPTSILEVAGKVEAGWEEDKETRNAATQQRSAEIEALQEKNLELLRENEEQKQLLQKFNLVEDPIIMELFRETTRRYFILNDGKTGKRSVTWPFVLNLVNKEKNYLSQDQFNNQSIEYKFHMWRSRGGKAIVDEIRREVAALQ